MFRQVVVQTWAGGVTSEQKQAMTAGLAALGQIPEVVSARGGSDGGYFAGNWGAVAVLDFADLNAARRYVAHPAHQAVIADYSAPLTDQRAVVQYEWGCGSIVGFHHVKLPVNDVGRSRQWYVSVLGFEPDLEFIEDGALRGVALYHPVADVRLALRHDPARAVALAGFDVTAMAVGTRQDLALVAERARAAGAVAGPLERGREGWTCDLTDPDGLIVRLYTHERHG
jgi:catechol 2,3-dioxygenase-like lactoylglutathione lyase family enzyme